MSDIYEYKSKHDFQIKDGQPHGWIQWKGTDVCIDLHCECGHHGHFDGDFLYYYECPECHAKYAVGQNVKLIKLIDKDHIDYVEEGIGFKTSEPETEFTKQEVSTENLNTVRSLVEIIRGSEGGNWHVERIVSPMEMPNEVTINIGSRNAVPMLGTQSDPPENIPGVLRIRTLNNIRGLFEGDNNNE